MSTRGRTFDRRPGLYFQHAREVAGLDQKAATDALGISIGTLSRYENGRVPIPDAMVAKLAALYEVAPDGWRQSTTSAEPTAEAPVSSDAAAFVRTDPRYWSARWDQAVLHLRQILHEQESLATEMRESVYGELRRQAMGQPVEPRPIVIPPEERERLDRRIADQSRPDVPTDVGRERAPG